MEVLIQQTWFFAIFIDNGTKPFVRESNLQLLGLLTLTLPCNPNRLNPVAKWLITYNNDISQMFFLCIYTIKLTKGFKQPRLRQL